MNKQVIYDNHANNIEYFSLHKPVKRDIKEISDQELLDIHLVIEEKTFGLTVLYNETKNESTFTKLSKLTAFKTAIRIQMRKRKLESYANMNLRIIGQKQEIENLVAINKAIKEGGSTGNTAKQLKNQLDIAKSQIVKYEKLYEQQKQRTINVDEAKLRNERIQHVFKDLVKSKIGREDFLDLIAEAEIITNNK